MKGLKMTFYVFLFGGILLFTGTEISGIGLQAIPDRTTLGNLVMLALVPTVISNLALVRAIKNIGSTLTSVFGSYGTCNGGMRRHCHLRRAVYPKHSTGHPAHHFSRNCHYPKKMME